MASSTAPVAPTLQPAGAPSPGEKPEAARDIPVAGVAARLVRVVAGRNLQLLYVATGERRAEELARAVQAFAGGELEVVLLPPWDCLPYDRASPSREIMGHRMAALRRLQASAKGSRLLVTSPEALIQRLPPAEAVEGAAFTLRTGDRLDREALAAFARRTGYVSDDRTDEPGELLILGEVVDVFPPEQDQPIRAKLSAEDRIVSLEAYDPLSQRSTGGVAELILGPASELIATDDDGVPREAGVEHRLAVAYREMRTVFDLLSDLQLLAEAPVGERAGALIEQVEEAWRTQTQFADASRPPAEPPTGLYLSRDELKSRLAAAPAFQLDLQGLGPAPRFAAAANPGRAFSKAVEAARDVGRRVVLTGLPHELRPMTRALERGLGLKPGVAEGWADAREGDAVVALQADIVAGFEDGADGLLVLAASDVLGGRIAVRRANGRPVLSEPELRLDDVVIHEDHGVGVLRSLERVEVGGVKRDVLRLEYHGGATVLAGVEELDRIWRYGAEAEAVTLDRLKGDGWIKRRAAVSAAITQDACALVERAKARAAATAEFVKPPKAAYARFAARFAFPETPDQKEAIAAVLDDLASGRPMDRLVCGDVGFGKTEVALRAAAGVALAGRQVALAAPTTVLARQHVATFERRFAGTGVRVAQLSPAGGRRGGQGGAGGAGVRRDRRRGRHPRPRRGQPCLRRPGADDPR